LDVAHDLALVGGFCAHTTLGGPRGADGAFAAFATHSRDGSNWEGKPAPAIEKPGAGEANRTPDPNLGKDTALRKIGRNPAFSREFSAERALTRCGTG
jgi:hypothetical protein